METIKGYIQEQPEMFFTQTGKAITKFPIADTEEEANYSNFKRIICWEKLVEIANDTLLPRDFVYIKGYWKERIWENPDKSTGHIKEFTAYKIWLQKEENKLLDIEELDKQQDEEQEENPEPDPLQNGS